MTTFTSEDREYSIQHPWPIDPWFGVEPRMPTPTSLRNQLEIDYFWPLTEQIRLDLDYTDCERPKLTVACDGVTGLTTISNATYTAGIGPQLTITPNNPVGTLSIGGMNIGLEKKPNYFQRLLHNLLGFNWKDK